MSGLFSIKGIKVGYSTLGGRGVFASKNFNKNDTVELCPYVLVYNEECKGKMEDYVFMYDDHCYAAVLGYGMLYNHSSHPNIYHISSTKYTDCYEFKAKRDIIKGEELMHDYGKEWWASRNLISR